MQGQTRDWVVSIRWRVNGKKKKKKKEKREESGRNEDDTMIYESR